MRKSKNRILPYALVVATVLSAFGQASVSGQKTPLIKEDLPSVYLTFVRQLQSKSNKSSAVEEYLLFRITNNSRWPIILQKSGPYITEADVGLFYLIDTIEKNEWRAGSLSCHVCSFGPLGPGKSLSFAVPLEHACNDAKMTVVFRYEWENDFSSSAGSETKHSSIFYFKSIPESILPILKEKDKKFSYQQNLCYVQ